VEGNPNIGFSASQVTLQALGDFQVRVHPGYNVNSTYSSPVATAGGGYTQKIAPFDVFYDMATYVHSDALSTFKVPMINSDGILEVEGDEEKNSPVVIREIARGTGNAYYKILKARVRLDCSNEFMFAMLRDLIAEKYGRPTSGLAFDGFDIQETAGLYVNPLLFLQGVADGELDPASIGYSVGHVYHGFDELDTEYGTDDVVRIRHLDGEGNFGAEFAKIKTSVTLCTDHSTGEREYVLGIAGINAHVLTEMLYQKSVGVVLTRGRRAAHSVNARHIVVFTGPGESCSLLIDTEADPTAVSYMAVDAPTKIVSGPVLYDTLTSMSVVGNYVRSGFLKLVDPYQGVMGVVTPMEITRQFALYDGVLDFGSPLGTNVIRSAKRFGARAQLSDGGETGYLEVFSKVMYIVALGNHLLGLGSWFAFDPMFELMFADREKYDNAMLFDHFARIQVDFLSGVLTYHNAHHFIEVLGGGVAQYRVKGVMRLGRGIPEIVELASAELPASAVKPVDHVVRGKISAGRYIPMRVDHLEAKSP